MGWKIIYFWPRYQHFFITKEFGFDALTPQVLVISL
jgi:hypothetical protein